MHKHLQRLERVWVEPPIYFITTGTEQRRRILAQDSVAKILIDEWRTGSQRHSWLVGRYVIMPDHVHFFCAPEREAKSLSDFVGAWKWYTSRRINTFIRPGTASPATTARSGARALWQAEFFDHLIRSDESYDEKWEYVRNNPVRAGLVTSADTWRYAGELTVFRC
jgi:REP element-mobilizing transposase RayT